MGEALFKQHYGEAKSIASAGVGALVGYPADPMALEVASEHGLDMEQHRARQLDMSIVQQSELILVYEQGQKQWIEKQFPIARGRVFMMSRWEDDLDVPDPYRRPKEAFEMAYQQSKVCVDSWVSKI